jgi:type 1 glutamine amidotransferase
VRKVLVLVAVLFLACAGTAQAADKVLVFSKTAGFRHDSIPQGIAAIEAIGAASSLGVDKTEDASAFTAANLAQYKAVIWLSTTGDVLNEAQQTAFEGYIKGGGGYVGVHAAADTEYDWPWYGQLVGAWFKSHPATQQATIDVGDRVHPSTKDVPATWTRTDEWYDYKRNPRADVHVLAELQESSYSGGTMGSDHPIAWCRAFDGGRTWYTGLGHTQQSYTEAAFRSHLTGGILWAAGLAAGDCSVTPQPEPCEAASDEFDAALDCRWTFVRPNTATYGVSGGALRITTENGDLWGNGNSAKNLILQKAPSGAWEVTT